jgi:hypothetical protein
VERKEAEVGVHVTRPHVLDTHNTPLRLPGLNAQRLLARPAELAHFVATQCVAELILSAPSMIGSMELLFNPTGLLSKVNKGFKDLYRLPLQGLGAGDPAMLVTGVGLGSACLARHVTGWTLTSLAGFSTSAARIIRGGGGGGIAAKGGYF